MMTRNYFVGGFSGLALAAFASLSANAAPISATFSQALSTAPVTISFDGATVASLFAASGGYGPGASVSTVGTGEVTTLSGTVTDFEAGSTIDQTGELYTFASYPAMALIPYSAVDDFIGLSVTLNDVVHYGYAEVSGPSLVSVGFETAAGATILTGATGVGTGITVSTPVSTPEPGSIALLVTGLAMLAVRGRRPKIGAV